MHFELFCVALMCLSVNAQWDCTTKIGGKGQCMDLDECDTLKSMLTSSKRDRNTYETLKMYNCGYNSKDPKVCCPLACKTYRGEPGVCTKLDDCDRVKRKMANYDPSFYLVEIFKLIESCNMPGTGTSLKVCCNLEPVDDRSPSTGTSTTTGSQNSGCALSAFPPDPSSQCCGVETYSPPRIFGGNATAVDQFPWLVMIEYERIGYSCGGSLISGRYVLTAAHCLVGANRKTLKAVSVRIGEYNVTNPGRDCVEVDGNGQDCTDGSFSVDIENYIVHEEYNLDVNKYTKNNDIGLIRLKETVNYTDFVRPICLPRSDFTISPPDPLLLYISGWGIYNASRLNSDVKLFAQIPYVKREQCDDRYARFGGVPLAQTQICGGGEANKDTCSGDSGGPLMLLKNNTYEIVGIISYGTSTCGLENWPSVYTKVYEYIDWILKNIKH